MSFSEEQERVDDFSHRMHYEGVILESINYCGNLFKRFMKPGNVLEIGPGRILAQTADSYSD